VSSEALAVKTNAQSITHVDELRLFPVPRQTPTMQTIDYEHMLDAWAYTNQHPRHRFLSDPDVLHSNEVEPPVNGQIRMSDRVESSQRLQNHRNNFPNDLKVVKSRHDMLEA